MLLMASIGICSCQSAGPQLVPALNAGVYSSNLNRVFFKGHEVTLPEIDKFIVLAPADFENLLKFIVETRSACEVKK